MKWVIKILIICFFLLHCQSEEKKIPTQKEIETKVEQKTTKSVSEKQQELRLTYHAVWVDKQPFEVLISESLFGTGNSYQIQYIGIGSGLVKNLKLSSTDRENQSQFRYLKTQYPGKEQVFYFQWGTKKSSVVLFPASEGQTYCRWEGIHNGFLLIFETEVESDRPPQVLAKIWDQFVQSSLEVY
ncbi:hypothetical protein P3G55_06750 [Leptospira sp. 96542]|nr:hypothetical protein [Leptospira sp. 96542]